MGQLATGGARWFRRRAAALKDGTSRVTGDRRARICEGLGVKFLGPTRRTLFAVMGITSDSLWALFAGSFALRLNRNSHWNRTQRYVSGGMLISLGVATALAGSGGKK